METNTPQPTASGAEIPQITVQDLAGLQNVIDVACQRGAFRAEEMKLVGELYDRLASFLKAVQPAVTPPDQDGVAEITQPQGEE